MDTPLFLFSMALLAPLAKVAYIVAHEMSHATAALLLTRSKVTVTLGPIDADAEQRVINSRWLAIAMTRNPARWKSGYCSSDMESVSIARQCAILLAGPVAPAVAGGIALITARMLHFHPIAIAFSFVFFGIAMLSLIGNLTPRRRPIFSHSSHDVYNDGTQLSWLLRRRRS
jgi:hypothetical protein